MAEFAYREAGLDDAADIHALLLLLAPEIPILVDTLEREEALYALIRNCARSGESWVAVAEPNRIVGFVLVEPNPRGRHYAEREILELHYAGVAPDQRNQGIFKGLIARVLARMVPIAVTVSRQNRSDMARRLETLGFRETGAPGAERIFHHEPGQAR